MQLPSAESTSLVVNDYAINLYLEFLTMKNNKFYLQEQEREAGYQEPSRPRNTQYVKLKVKSLLYLLIFVEGRSRIEKS